jgi:hypothetical protein
MTKSKLAEAAKEYACKDVEPADLKTFEHSWTFEMLTKGFEAGAQWYERSLEGVGEKGEYFYAYKSDVHALAPRLDLGNSCDIRVFLYPLNTEMPHLMKFIEALPVQALIASQQREIEALKKNDLTDANIKLVIENAEHKELNRKLANHNADYAEEIQRLRKALEFYADAVWIPTKSVSENSWKTGISEETFTSFSVNRDGGKTAREALKESR